MTNHFPNRIPKPMWPLIAIAGMALLACLNVARAQQLPPQQLTPVQLPHNVKVIYIHRPDYLNRFPTGPFSDNDVRDATQLAKIGDAEAQANLGVMYQSRGEYQKAVYWYQAAANAGVTTAQYNMGTLYFNGEGVPKDYARALQWFTTAANRGNAYAQFQLGLMYFTGQGVTRDPEREIYWYRKAAAQGLAAAAYNLGVAYANGEGVPADDVKAYAWMLLAGKFAREGSGIDTKGSLAILASNLSPAQIRQAEDLSHRLAGDSKSPALY